MQCHKLAFHLQSSSNRTTDRRDSLKLSSAKHPLPRLLNFTSFTAINLPAAQVLIVEIISSAVRKEPQWRLHCDKSIKVTPTNTKQSYCPLLRAVQKNKGSRDFYCIVVLWRRMFKRTTKLVIISSCLFPCHLFQFFEFKSSVKYGQTMCLLIDPFVQPP
jgi:hypothetical protein